MPVNEPSRKEIKSLVLMLNLATSFQPNGKGCIVTGTKEVWEYRYLLLDRRNIRMWYVVQIQATGQEEEHEDAVCGADTGYWTGGGA